MELNLRPMTEAERLYCYSQSQQIMAQTGCIGHLRADMDTDGRGFFSNWDDHIGYLKTQEFKDEFEGVIDSLRFDSGVLANRTAVQKFCATHPEAQITPDRPDYGFRTDTVQYAYLLRLNPNKGEYNLYCYCYRRDWLNKHIQDAARGIRFIDSHYKELFRIPDGGQIRIIYPDGETLTKGCRYICDEQNSAYHDYSYVWYWFCAKILGIKKCNLILVPISTQFKLVIRGTFPDYPLDLNDYPSISEENACLIAVSNVDAGTDEVNLVIEDTYEILDSQIPEEKRSLQTIRVSRCDGTNNRHFSQKLIDAVNGTVRQKGSIPRLNVFATTNPMNSKQIAMNAFVQGGRGNVAHLYVFQQESKGNRVFSKRGRKIY